MVGTLHDGRHRNVIESGAEVDEPIGIEASLNS